MSKKEKEVKFVVTGELNEKQIAALVAKHGELVPVEVFMDEFEHDDHIESRISIGYFKKPGLDILSIVMKFISVDDQGKVSINDLEQFTNITANNLFVAGDEQIRTDEMARFGAAQALFRLMKPRVARIKKP